MNPRSFSFRHVLTLLLIAIVAGCHSSPDVRRYALQGDVIAVEKKGNEAIIRHQDIDGYMKAMTMGYRVKNAEELEKLHAGQRIRAELVVTKDSSWIEHIVVESQGGTQPQPQMGALHVPEPGEVVPDFQLIDQDGKRFHLTERYPALVTFIYTRCPLPDYCPRMNTNFQGVAQRLQQTGDKLQLVTISFDPEFDTPAVLKKYREQWAKTPEMKKRWTFAVPAKEDMPKLLHFFAIAATPEQGIITHNLSTTLISREGKVEAWWHGNEWTPEDMQKAISQSAD
jgi:protein SCO1/2